MCCMLHLWYINTDNIILPSNLYSYVIYLNHARSHLVIENKMRFMCCIIAHIEYKLSGHLPILGG